MTRSLIWISGDVVGWACSNCRWKFPVPTLMGGDEAKEAYDRLAAVKFREHQCETDSGYSAGKTETPRAGDSSFGDRARALIKKGYTPKVAVELVLHEMEIEHRHNSKAMERARADAEDFLSRARRGLI